MRGKQIDFVDNMSETGWTRRSAPTNELCARLAEFNHG